MSDENIGISPEAATMIIQNQMMRDFAEAGSMKSADVAVSKVAAATVKAKKGDPEPVYTAWILQQDTTMNTDGSGPIRFRAGARIDDPYVKVMLENTGAVLIPTL